MQRVLVRSHLAPRRPLGPLGILGLLLAVAPAGCAADSGGEAIVVLRNILASEGCTLNPSATEPGIGQGSLDLIAPTGYVFIAQMRSQITALDNEVEQRTISLTGANIDIAFPDATVFTEAELAELRDARLTHFKEPFLATLPPNGALVDQGFRLIPAELNARIAAKTNLPRFGLQVIVTFTVLGTMGSGDVTSQAYSYPVTLGLGIAAVNAGTCPLPMDFGTPRPGYSCNPFQDGVVDCCTSPQGLVCPAKVDQGG